jgi:hypothetical protein
MHLRRLAPAAVLALLAAAPVVRAGDEPIRDNSFLLEEAYNQEPGVIQHISAFNRARDGEWAYSFTEEWPVGGETHQASVTLNFAGLRNPSRSGIGDVALNYRWQAIGDGDARVALAPRLSALLPTGNAEKGLGTGGAGLQVNLPMSTVLARRVVAHTNVGGTWVPSALAASGGRGHLATFAAGQSLVWLAHQHVNLLTEVLYTRTRVGAPAGAELTESLTVNPGVRAAIDFASGLQIVPGIAVPIGVGPSRGERGVFLYLSFEHPFSLAGRSEAADRARPQVR